MLRRSRRPFLRRYAACGVLPADRAVAVRARKPNDALRSSHAQSRRGIGAESVPEASNGSRVPEAAKAQEADHIRGRPLPQVLPPRAAAGRVELCRSSDCRHGLSHAALTRDFTDVVSKTSKNITASTFVNALYATIGGRAADPGG